ncbi:glycosyltransferase [uncultured Clostridium sp.]|uniref:glycosyltransferase n=1 Tax=uncultured Clostridium sp. TaxID=59620 RepID=UPI0025CF5337|nr:glycosyltransferase [uncultured Clostridium sp.]
MKKIFIIHSNMEIGGAETSLIGLLKSIDYSNYKIDLLLLDRAGELMEMIPKEVNIIDTPTRYRSLIIPIKDVIKQGQLGIAFTRIIGKTIALLNSKCKNFTTIGYMIKEFSHKYSMPLLPKIKGQYDIAISFIDPHYIVNKKVNAKVKLGWLHTDFSRVKINEKVDFNMWDGCDYIVSVSDDCKKAFDDRYRNLKGKSIVIENILTFEFVEKQSKLIDVTDEIVREDGVIIICSIGRFSKQKNFDNVPNIAKRIIDSGILIKWYLIGYGIEEKIIKKKIMEEGMENNVFILGKKSNPYPYIKACDIYVQPSRFEGKAVTVREAQMLNKPVVITNFKTAKSQLEDGVDGIIVPMDNKECASGIISLINNNKLREGMINNTKIKDYSNKKEIYKLYNFIK